MTTPELTPTRLRILAREVRPGDTLIESVWGHLGHKPIHRKVWAVDAARDPDEIALSVTSDVADKDTPDTATMKYYPSHEVGDSGEGVDDDE